jgi:uncharacterized protein (TIGR01777 family)
VNCRYSRRNLDEINQSRVRSTRALGDAIHRCLTPPEVWIQASSTAIYGDAGNRECTETSPPGEGIPVRTCLAWERAFVESPTPLTRRVHLRISFVLKRGEGALRMLERLTRWGFGGSMGGGRQFISWIHWRDMNRLFIDAIGDRSIEGCYNAASPGPVTNAEFMRALRRVLGRPWSPPVPRLLVPFGCWMLGTEPVLALTGRRAIPARLIERGFAFEFLRFDSALDDIFA